MAKIMLVFAHPDDEAFTTAGTVAKYIRAGWEAHLICATRGEAGSRGPYETTSVPLGDIRQKELEAAGTILGLASITLLGYKDGTLSALNPGELEAKIYREMVKLSPGIVITFEPTRGISNHPDHKKIGLATTVAFQRFAGSALVLTKPKLYYACIPQSIVEYLKRKHILPATMFGEPWLGTPDKYVTTVIDISRFRGLKKKALQAHLSQTEDVDRFLSFSQNSLARQEYFILRMEGISEVFMGKTDRVNNKL